MKEGSIRCYVEFSHCGAVYMLAMSCQTCSLMVKKYEKASLPGHFAHIS